jgi:hypothetical protein
MHLHDFFDFPSIEVGKQQSLYRESGDQGIAGS